MLLETILSRLAGAAALFAEGDAGAAADGAQSPIISLLPIMAIIVLFYFLLIRPQRREQARRQTMLSSVKKNERVLTAGGIFGVVTNVNVEADEVTIKVDESTNTKLRMTLSSIVRIVGDEPSGEGAS
jgi:preprotein translocase subunit YajC